MSGIVDLSATKLGSAPLTGHKRQGLRKLSPDLISKAIDETNAQTIRVGLTFLGTTAFCLLSLFSPDSALLGGGEKINLPLAGPVSFFGFMLLGPAVLIMLRLYLQIYVELSDRLDRLARSVRLVRAPTLVPLKNPLIRLFGGLIFYLLLPVTVMLFAWKAAVFLWGAALSAVAVAVIVGHVMVPLSRFTWRSRALLGAGVAALAWGLIFDLGPRRRPFDLYRANLSGHWLPRYDLPEANLKSSNLRDANLSGANLSGAKLFVADLIGANLSGANLSDASDASDASIPTDPNRPDDVNLSGANLRSANLRLAYLQKANLSGANLEYAQLGGANLQQANLSGADLSATNLSGAQLFVADLIGANLLDANLSGAFLRGANLSDAKSAIKLMFGDLTGAVNLSGTDLIGADLRRASLRKANLSGADLDGADLREADLSGADLSGANLSDADLREANLSGADLSGAINSTKTQLDEACGNAKTKLPKGLPKDLTLKACADDVLPD
jgi:uncharacterized protein YjbI with pentapeptide repeats